MTSKIVYWTPGLNNSGQTLQYRPIGSTTWTSTALLPAMTNTYVISGIDNELYECKIISNCSTGTTQESSIIKTFLSSGLSWSFQALSAHDIKISWNFPTIDHITHIDVAIYLGTTLIEAQGFSSSTTGQYVFSGLTSSTGYTLVYGVNFTQQTFPENPYVVGEIDYLTPIQSLTQYKRRFNILTF